MCLLVFFSKIEEKETRKEYPGIEDRFVVLEHVVLAWCSRLSSSEEENTILREPFSLIGGNLTRTVNVYFTLSSH